MDRIRAALGDPAARTTSASPTAPNSGAVYAHLFPNNVRVEVLDGAVDPLTDDITSFANQLQGFESAFDQFAADCCHRTAVQRSRQPAPGRVRPDRAQADQTPIPSSDSRRAPRRATGSLVLTGVRRRCTRESSGPTSATRCTAAQQRRRQGDARAGRPVQPAQPRRHVQQHLRRQHRHRLQRLQARSDRRRRSAPPRQPGRPAYPMFGAVGGPVAVLLPAVAARTAPRSRCRPRPRPRRCWSIGNLHDPATPYQGAKDLASDAGQRRVADLGRRGPHLLPAGQHCIDNYVEQLPDRAARCRRPNTTCPARDRPHARSCTVDAPSGACAASRSCCTAGGPRSARAPRRATAGRAPDAPVRLRAARGRARRRAGRRAAALRGARLERRASAPPSPTPGGHWTQLAERFPERTGRAGRPLDGRADGLLRRRSPDVAAVVGLAPWLEPGDPTEQLAGRRMLIAARHARPDDERHGVGGSTPGGRATVGARRSVTSRSSGDGHAMLRRARCGTSSPTGYALRRPVRQQNGPIRATAAANVLAEALAGAGSLVV